MGVVAAAWRPVLEFFVAALFSRLHRDAVVDQKVRERIMALVAARPGIHLRGIQAELGTGVGATKYHLGVLVQAGFLRVHRLPGALCYVAGDAATPFNVGATAALRSRRARNLLQAIVDKPGQHALQLSHRCAVKPGVTYYHLRRMANVGLVELRQEAGILRVFPQLLAQQLA